MARGLPDGVTVAQLFLVQFVLVRIQVRQPNKKKPQRKLRFFYAREGCMEQRVKRAQCVDKAKTSSLDFWIGVTL